LGAAYRRGIVHRDIKPDNLYVCTEAEGPPTIKLLDFGISKMSLAGKVTDRMTRTGTVLGTPYYMAPEQAAGKSDVDHRADLYSMGVILYEAATGRVPFEGENYNQLILKIFTEPYPQPREVNPEIPPELERIIIRAMDRNRDARYPDAEAMIHDLVEILGPDGRQDWHLPAHTGAAVERLSRTPLASSALRPQTPALARATQTTGGAEEPDRKSRTGLYVGLGIGALVAIGVVVFLVVGGGGGGEANDPATKTAAAGEPAGGEDAGAVAPPEDVVEPADAAGAKTAESDAGAPEPPADVATGAVDPPETTSAVPPPPSEAVRIVVQGAPDGAEILWDGAVVPDVSFAVRRGEIGVVLEVRAEGFKPLRQLLVPSEDRVVSVDLERLPVRTTSGGGRPPGRDAGTVAPPPADAGGSSSGGIRTNFPGGDTPPARDAGGGGIRTSWP
jgi:serine/threonine-protein kinase